MTDEMENAESKQKIISAKDEIIGPKADEKIENETAGSRDGARSITVGDFPKDQARIRISDDLVVVEFYITDRIKAIHGFPGWLSERMKLHFMALDIQNQNQKKKILVPGQPPDGNGFINGVRRMLKH